MSTLNKDSIKEYIKKELKNKEEAWMMLGHISCMFLVQEITFEEAEKLISMLPLTPEEISEKTNF